ncbi:uncharacterized protein cubi_01014 [Cryptosporidium ubiquitum]|uniref:Uncharacterized protein n=1 Tax=Cryptosporidium ubiquitum TaxID=857276 RepID=A0A1J4MDC8_9CRYT|nr:uncharacterized protein cubi_01014 [Cryptosporidium ubiquitum]OII70869.1 hypothetical protein cubi_01014 [Cryptosporidium ubiquitum]
MNFEDQIDTKREENVKVPAGNELKNYGGTENGFETIHPKSESFSEIEVKNEERGIKRRFQPNQFLKFSSLVLVPGKPRKWKRVQRRFGRSEGAWLYRWEYIPESIDNLFMENLELMARGVVGPRRTGRTTRAVSFHMRENPAGPNQINMFELEGNYEQS